MFPSRHSTFGVLHSTAIFLALLFPSLHPFAASTYHPFVRTANYYLLSGSALENPQTLDALAAFDLIIIPSEAQIYNRPFFTEIRRRHPQIKILAYVPAVSWNDAYWHDALHEMMKAGIQDDWWLRDAQGNRKSIWPRTTALNLASGWTSYLASHVADRLIASGLWDGIFYDEVQDSIDGNGPVDTDRDGQNDMPAEANARWASGFANLFRLTREKIGPDPILISNGSSNSAFAPYVNGRMYESFPSTGSAVSHWSDALRDYVREGKTVVAPPILVVNVNTGNAGDQTDYRNMRFGLATTLLGDGFFSFDFGTESHAQLWSYDEYHAFLGSAKSDPRTVGPQVWTRDFSHGKVVLNAGSSPQTVQLDGEYEHVHGTQDMTVNNGSISSRVRVNAQDGIVLLRPIEQIRDAAFPNGAFARIFNGQGLVKRTGFFAYEESARGGTRVLQTDLDQDGVWERIVADETFVTITAADGRMLLRLAPYGEYARPGINVAAGDVDGDGRPELVTSPRVGAPQIRVYRLDGSLLSSFLAYDAKFRGGASVAVAQVRGESRAEIITGAGAGGGPHVRVFPGEGKPLASFFAYDKKFTGGVHVAAGDVEGDGTVEIITGAGAGGGPHVRVFSGKGILKRQFFAGDAKSREGIDVAVADVEGDGFAEIVGLSTNVFTLTGEGFEAP